MNVLRADICVTCPLVDLKEGGRLGRTRCRRSTDGAARIASTYACLPSAAADVQSRWTAISLLEEQRHFEGGGVCRTYRSWRVMKSTTTCNEAIIELSGWPKG